MNHVDILALRRNEGLSLANKSLVSRATGSFYTHAEIGQYITRQLISLLKGTTRKTISIIDPFAGDGRLVCWLIEAAHHAGIKAKWQISLWDRNGAALATAAQQIDALQRRTGLAMRHSLVCTNSFDLASRHEGRFDIVITNPPWEALKPDRRELAELTATDRINYVDHMRAMDQRLASMYPNSQPTKKFAGWGTNLSRVGLEASLKLLANGGHLGIVLPSSTFADQVSAPLRSWAVERLRIDAAGYFPAEARLFDNVDQASMALIGTKALVPEQRFHLHIFDPDSGEYQSQKLNFQFDKWRANGCCIPFTIRGNAQEFFDSISTLPTWANLEDADCGFWAGRELDETGIEAKLTNAGRYRFVKGKMVGRFQFLEQATKKAATRNFRIPRSADRYRIAWRDVSRPTQRRRMQATMIAPGYVTGNSLNVAMFENQDKQTTLALLAIVNSLAFEVQVRARSTTSHISLGVVRGVHVPDIRHKKVAERLSAVALRCLSSPGRHEPELEALVAKEYGLGKDALASLLLSFPKVTDTEAAAIMASSAW